LINGNFICQENKTAGILFGRSASRRQRQPQVKARSDAIDKTYFAVLCKLVHLFVFFLFIINKQPMMAGQSLKRSLATQRLT